jgi:hypothetical protein
LTLSSGEIWGATTTLGTLVGFFTNYFHRNTLIDIAPGNLVPTWSNGRAGTDSIAKRLDCSFISKDLLASVEFYRAWVELPFIFYHAPIILQLDLPLIYKAFPFKFNPLWTTDHDFIKLVQKLWSDPKYLQEVGRQRRLV